MYYHKNTQVSGKPLKNSHILVERNREIKIFPSQNWSWVASIGHCDTSSGPQHRFPRPKAMCSSWQQSSSGKTGKECGDFYQFVISHSANPGTTHIPSSFCPLSPAFALRAEWRKEEISSIGAGWGNTKLPREREGFAGLTSLNNSSSKLLTW